MNEELSSFLILFGVIAVPTACLILLRRRYARETVRNRVIDSPRIDPSMSPDELVTIARFHFPNDAELYRIKLESQGISSAVFGGALGGVLSGSILRNPMIELKVRARDADRAAHILGEDLD